MIRLQFAPQNYKKKMNYARKSLTFSRNTSKIFVYFKKKQYFCKRYEVFILIYMRTCAGGL